MAGRRRKVKPKGPLHYLATGLSLGAFLFVLLLAAIAVIVPAVVGATPMTVLTGSMEPAYPPGTLVIVRPVAQEEIRIGDVITYQLESGRPEVVTHRVVGITMTDQGQALVTKGDNNPSADPNPVLPVQVRGEVWYGIPYLGWVNTFVGSEHRAWIVPSIAGILLAYAAALVVSVIAGGGRRRKRSPNRGAGGPEPAASSR